MKVKAEFDLQFKYILQVIKMKQINSPSDIIEELSTDEGKVEDPKESAPRLVDSADETNNTSNPIQESESSTKDSLVNSAKEDDLDYVCLNSQSKQSNNVKNNDNLASPKSSTNDPLKHKDNSNSEIHGEVTNDRPTNEVNYYNLSAIYFFISREL